MSSDWIKENRLDLQQQATVFNQGIANLGSSLNLSTSEIAAFNTALTSYNSDMAAWEDAMTVEKVASETFANDKTNLKSLMRKYNKRMQAAPGITNAKRAEIGLPIPGSSTTVVPKKVNDLIATPIADGTVKLKWNRSGNANSVIFIVEKSSDSIEWEFAANSTSTKITLSGFAPGTTTYFRIVASRGAALATPSNVEVIYPGGESSELRIAA